jgi:GDP-L-fucose synthase
VDDLAEACILVIKENTNEILFNVGSGTEISISNLAKLIKKIIGYDGDIIFDNSKPDGVMQKLIDSTRIKNLGWEFKINLETGIKMTLKNSFK